MLSEKTKSMRLLLIATCWVLTQLLLTGCDKRFDPFGHTFPPPSLKPTGDLAVRLTDQPGNYLQVNIDIKEIQVHLTDSNDSAGWVSLDTRDTIYDLLTLQNNITAALANGDTLPAGKICQLRMILGSNNTVMLNDSSIHSLTIPSGQQTGIKINVNSTIAPNATTTITLDFDASQSVHKKGTGDYQLSPVIKVKNITVI